MFRMNCDNHDEPAVCSFRSLTAIAWPDRSYEDARPFLTGLVFDLRKKLEHDAAGPTLLTTHPGQGYALAVRPFCAIRARSPFVAGPPILEPSAFFGRVREVERLLRLWTRRPLHSALIIGARRSGKTSLLHYMKALTRTPSSLLRPDQARWWASHTSSDGVAVPATLRMAYVDFQDPRTGTAEYVLGEILRGCGLPSTGACEYGDFIAIASSQLDAPTVVLLDEVDKGLRRPGLAELWGTLRSAASRHPRQLLAFAVACRAIPAVENSTPYESPLLNIIGEVIELGPFTREEATELIAASPRTFPDADVEWMLEQSECWPALLQVFCDTRLSAFDTDDEGGWRQHALLRARQWLHLKQR